MFESRLGVWALAVVAVQAVGCEGGRPEFGKAGDAGMSGTGDAAGASGHQASDQTNDGASNDVSSVENSQGASSADDGTTDESTTGVRTDVSAEDASATGATSDNDLSNDAGGTPTDGVTTTKPRTSAVEVDDAGEDEAGTGPGEPDAHTKEVDSGEQTSTEDDQSTGSSSATTSSAGGTTAAQTSEPETEDGCLAGGAQACGENRTCNPTSDECECEEGAIECGDACCGSDSYCEGASCAPLKANGEVCSDGNECTNSVCTEGVCCGSACTGTCQSCVEALTGQPDGVCADVEEGKSHANDCTAEEPSTCGNDGTCDGNGGCRQYQSDTQCAQASCSDETFTPASMCSGNGSGCPPVSPTSCTFGCSTSGPAACASSCPAGQNLCDGACVDTVSSESHCGAGCQTCQGSTPLCVNSACVQCQSGGDCDAPGSACSNGTCQCRPPSAQNLLQDASFRTSQTTQSAWGATTGWTSDDADECQGSGSISFSSQGSIGQCVQVESDTRYYFGVKYFQTTEQHVFCSLVTYDDTECEGGTQGGLSLIGLGTEVNEWAVARNQLDTASNVQSASFSCTYWGGFVQLDHAYVSTSDNY